MEQRREPGESNNAAVEGLKVREVRTRKRATIGKVLKISSAPLSGSPPPGDRLAAGPGVVLFSYLSQGDVAVPRLNAVAGTMIHSNVS